MMCAATDVYAVAQDPRFLQMAKDAADWTLTWMYFHNVPLKPESGLLHAHVNTVGWTFISTQNQEIDVFGYFIAPDFYRLGVLGNDARYRRIGRVLFEAATQTLSRPGAMFGPVPGIQAEHYNHSNCTYVGGQPGTWRGSQHSMGIAWTIAGDALRRQPSERPRALGVLLRPANGPEEGAPRAIWRGSGVAYQRRPSGRPIQGRVLRLQSLGPTLQRGPTYNPAGFRSPFTTNAGEPA